MNTLNRGSETVALTVRPEHRLVLVHKVVNQTIRISSKAILAAVVLTFLNMVI